MEKAGYIRKPPYIISEKARLLEDHKPFPLLETVLLTITSL